MKIQTSLPDDSDLSVRILATAEAVESIRSIWLELQSHPEADIDYFLLMLRLRPEIIRPHVVLVYEKGVPIALVAGRIEDGRLDITSGNRLFWKAKVRRLAMFYEGFMGNVDARVTRFVVQNLLQSLSQLEVDLMVWDGVHWQSSLRRLLRKQPGPLCRDYLARGTDNWIMRLPGSLDELFQKRMNKKRRYWARRTMRILADDFPGAIRHVRFVTPESIDQLCQVATGLARQTYQWTLAVGFRNTEEQRLRLELAARKGWLFAYVLYLGGQPAAFWICTLHQGVLHLDYTGFNPAFRKYEVGTLGLFQIIDEMCQAGHKCIDLGGGAYAYKKKLGDTQFKKATILTFAPSFRGIRLSVLRLLTLGPVEVVRRVAEKWGWEPALKRIWQTRYRPTKEPSEFNSDDEAVEPGFDKKNANKPITGIGINFCRLFFFSLFAAVIYFSWKPYPSVVRVPWMPAAIGTWFDQHDFAKNLLGFGTLSAAGFLAWGGRLGQRWSFKDLRALKPSRDIKMGLSFCLVVVALELGQLALPSRTCDWADVLAGWSGIALSWLCFRLGAFFLGPVGGSSQNGYPQPLDDRGPVPLTSRTHSPGRLV